VGRNGVLSDLANVVIVFGFEEDDEKRRFSFSLLRSKHFGATRDEEGRKGVDGFIGGEASRRERLKFEGGGIPLETFIENKSSSCKSSKSTTSSRSIIFVVWVGEGCRKKKKSFFPPKKINPTLSLLTVTL
jgi:hypothetical protein